jgi:hypothetical protein
MVILVQRGTVPTCSILSPVLACRHLTVLRGDTRLRIGFVPACRPIWGGTGQAEGPSAAPVLVFPGVGPDTAVTRFTSMVA